MCAHVLSRAAASDVPLSPQSGGVGLPTYSGCGLRLPTFSVRLYVRLKGSRLYVRLACILCQVAWMCRRTLLSCGLGLPISSVGWGGRVPVSSVDWRGQTRVLY